MIFRTKNGKIQPVCR